MNCRIWLYMLVPIETSSGQNGPKTTKNSNRPAAPSILDPLGTVVVIGWNEKFDFFQPTHFSMLTPLKTSLNLTKSNFITSLSQLRYYRARTLIIFSIQTHANYCYSSKLVFIWRAIQLLVQFSRKSGSIQIW